LPLRPGCEKSLGERDLIPRIDDQRHVVASGGHVERLDLDAHLLEEDLRGVEALGAVLDLLDPILGPVAETQVGRHRSLLMCGQRDPCRGSYTEAEIAVWVRKGPAR